MLLGDVGGLSGLFVSIASSLISILNYQKADNILVSNLYRAEKASSPEKMLKTELDPEKQSSCMEYFQSLLPKKCLPYTCLHRTKRDKYFERSRNAFNEEIDLVRIVQRLRFFDAAIRVLLPHDDLISL